MCIIVYKPKGIVVNEDFIKKMKICFRGNDDGCGYMYQEGDQVVIKKGFMTWVAAEKELRRFLGWDLPMVLHFRIATHGNVDRYTCHPFPLSDKEKELKLLKARCAAGVAHNGIISFCLYDKSLSDTQVFVRDYLSGIPIDSLKLNAVCELISEAAGGKIAIMFPDQVIMIGDFVKDNGVFYSNKSYSGSGYKYYSWYPKVETSAIIKSACDLCGKKGDTRNVYDYVSLEHVALCEACFSDFYFTCSVCGEILPNEYESLYYDGVCRSCGDYVQGNGWGSYLKGFTEARKEVKGNDMA